jgi:hypothetical protein
MEDVALWDPILAQGILEQTSLSEGNTELRLPSREIMPSSTQIKKTTSMQSTYECPFRLDDKQTRARLWKLFFPDKPLGEPEDNAVEKYFGIFDKYVKKDHPKDAFDKIVNES